MTIKNIGGYSHVGMLMVVIVKCPQCPTKIKLPATAATATCPKCRHRFETGSYADSLPTWVGAWGLAAVVLATLALLVASLTGAWLATLALASGGLVVFALGMRATSAARTISERVWLTLGGSLSGLVVCLAILAPGLLNNRWAHDFAVAQSDQNEQIAVPRDHPRDAGKVLTADDWADAVTEAIRQDDLLLRVEAVHMGSFTDKGAASFLLIHLEFANIGPSMITFQGFDHEKNLPALSDDLGNSYVFAEQRQRMPASGEPAFGAPKRGGVTLSATKAQGYQLVFESPSTGFKSLKLELPAGAWGRAGVYKFLISKPS